MLFTTCSHFRQIHLTEGLENKSVLGGGLADLRTRPFCSGDNILKSIVNDIWRIVHKILSGWFPNIIIGELFTILFFKTICSNSFSIVGRQKRFRYWLSLKNVQMPPSSLGTVKLHHRTFMTLFSVLFLSSRPVW